MANLVTVSKTAFALSRVLSQLTHGNSGGALDPEIDLLADWSCDCGPKEYIF